MPATQPYTHQPQPAKLPQEPAYQLQRRFGSQAQLMREDADSMALHMAHVYRDGSTDVAELQLQIGLATNARITMRMRPAELRALAASLLDAAHDIDANPASVLIEQAANAIETAKEKAAA